MTDNDLQRQAERRKILKGMIQKSFPDDEVTELTQEYAVWKIGISRDSNRIRCRIVVQASEPLMTDVNNHYEIVFNAAIKTLNNILNNPPLKNDELWCQATEIRFSDKLLRPSDSAFAL